MTKKWIITALVLAGLLLAAFSFLRPSTPSPLADHQASQQNVPPELRAAGADGLTTTHASRLVDNGFAPVGLCITGTLTRHEAEQQMLENISRLPLDVPPPTLITPQPTLTVTVTGLNQLPTDVIDIYVNMAADGSGRGLWRLVNQIGFSAATDADSIDIRAELPRLDDMQGWHLIIVEARYEDKPRSVWLHDPCGQLLYHAGADEFRSVGGES